MWIVEGLCLVWVGDFGGGRRGEVGSTLMDAFCERMRGWADLHICVQHVLDNGASEKRKRGRICSPGSFHQ